MTQRAFADIVVDRQSTILGIAVEGASPRHTLGEKLWMITEAADDCGPLSLQMGDSRFNVTTKGYQH
jgi:hypothetical protein